ncbi:hypothetical protein QAD02_024392 [Eretmocerus hayati]|uniref:Uncharacterized protein n=1 Tax=Eretmocerus hayati TaxID=131215 RepID=A0ACC2PYQ3_9HYME|nr:hypothetical protein QAD02_024392 [Eretmocerus hayati]
MEPESQNSKSCMETGSNPQFMLNNMRTVQAGTEAHDSPFLVVVNIAVTRRYSLAQCIITVIHNSTLSRFNEHVARERRTDPAEIGDPCEESPTRANFRGASSSLPSLREAGLSWLYVVVGAIYRKGSDASAVPIYGEATAV